MAKTYILTDEQLEIIEIALLHYKHYLVQDVERARASLDEIEEIDGVLLPWLETPLEVKITNNM